MCAILDNVMESSIILIDNIRNTDDARTREKIIDEYLREGNTKVTVDDFKEGLEWFNVTNPLSFEKELKGKLVILDFFTYCCINCLHILPKIRELEEEHSIEDGVVVVGIHSAKFDNEKDSSNILSALQRYGITHPVVNDAEGSMWSAFGIPCWPTLLVLSPSGCPVFIAVGESNMPELELVVRRAVAFYRGKGEISAHAISTTPLAHVESQGPLLFPGKVASCSSPGGPILAIADSGHHRILVCSYSGDVQFVVGEGTPGCLDGDFSFAKFFSPQGVTFMDSDTIYVADTENNAIRKIDLVSRKVSTVASKQINDQGSESSLSSPWDICPLPDSSGLLIAAAGSHQLWALFTRDVLWWRNTQMSGGMCVPVAGTGREENRNNVYPHAAAFAQPSGICVAPMLNAVFIADSESSSVRRMDLKDGRVSAVVGGGRSPTDLFCFGDVDGHQWDVRLQHPLGVAWSPLRGGTLYVADSYNHKLKVVMPEERSCETLLGTGIAGDSVIPGAEQLNEPGGLCSSPCGSYLYIADTNNNCVKVVHLQNTEDSSYSLRKLDVKLPKSNVDGENRRINGEDKVRVCPSGGTVTWQVNMVLPQGFMFTTGAPQRWTLNLPQAAGWTAEPSAGELSANGGANIMVKVPSDSTVSKHQVLFEATLFTCDSSSSCWRQNVHLALNIEYGEEALVEQLCVLRYNVDAKKAR